MEKKFTDGEIMKIDKDSLCIAKDGIVFDEIRPEHVKDIIDAFNRQKVTIHNQDEMIMAITPPWLANPPRQIIKISDMCWL